MILDIFQENTRAEKSLRTLVTVFILGYVVFFSTVLEAKYPARLVQLYQYPWWRLFVVGLVALGAWWCPRVGLAMGIAVFFYLNDMQILTSPFLSRKTE
jgi:hypothetical protein